MELWFLLNFEGFSADAALRAPPAQASRDCVQKTLKRLEDKIAGKVLAQIMYAMYSSEKAVGQRCACALAHLAAITDLQAAFVERKGLDIIIAMLTDAGKGEKRDTLHREAASAP